MVHPRFSPLADLNVAASVTQPLADSELAVRVSSSIPLADEAYRLDLHWDISSQLAGLAVS